MAFEGIRTVFDAFRPGRGARPGVYELARKAKKLLEDGENDAAVAVLRKALERFPGHSSLEDINHFLGQKRLRDSLSELQHVAEEARKVYVRTARAYADTDNTQKAIDFVTVAFRRFPECPELHLILGEIYLRRYLEDRLPEDGRRTLESLERACRLDPHSLLPRKYLAGFYARIGCFSRASEYLAALDAKNLDEEEQRYIDELRNYCLKHTDQTGDEDVEGCLAAVWDRGEFAVNCRDWASPHPPTFGRCDLKSVTVPFVVMEMAAKKCVKLPRVAALVAQNQIRSKTTKADDLELATADLEHAVREVASKSVEACHRMGLGHVKRSELKTTMGPLSLHMFADTWLGLLFKPDSSTTQVRTVTQQCLDLVAEGVGEIYESDS
ncbi:MAG: hypothetical protein AMK75_02530 [Planctomycetes bacterium SM23_65]|nr:MAG: hypothetical protein AMK75_02530 [Planctomycetes bacterium SM23_65]